MTKKHIKTFHERRWEAHLRKRPLELISKEESMEILFECVDDIIKWINKQKS